MSAIDHGDFKNVRDKPGHRVILVTGATGHVGSHVVAQLLRTGAVVRALTRDPASAGLPGGVDVVRGDLSAPSTLDACLKGVDAVFLLWPGLTADPALAVCRRYCGLSHGCLLVSCASGSYRPSAL